MQKHAHGRYLGVQGHAPDPQSRVSRVEGIWGSGLRVSGLELQVVLYFRDTNFRELRDYL